MLKVLLIDDDEFELRIVNQLLKNKYAHNFELSYAQNISEAANLLWDKVYDVILLDDKIESNMTAIETVPLIRAHANNVPLIIISKSLESDHLQDKSILNVFDIVDKFDLKARLEEGLLDTVPQPPA